MNWGKWRKWQFKRKQWNLFELLFTDFKSANSLTASSVCFFHYNSILDCLMMLMMLKSSTRKGEISVYSILGINWISSFDICASVSQLCDVKNRSFWFGDVKASPVTSVEEERRRGKCQVWRAIMRWSSFMMTCEWCHISAVSRRFHLKSKILQKIFIIVCRVGSSCSDPISSWHSVCALESFDSERSRAECRGSSLPSAECRDSHFERNEYQQGENNDFAWLSREIFRGTRPISSKYFSIRLLSKITKKI